MSHLNEFEFEKINKINYFVFQPTDGGTFDLFHLPKDFSGEPREVSTDGKRGAGNSAIFIARNRFAVLDKTRQVFILHIFNNNGVF